MKIIILSLLLLTTSLLTTLTLAAADEKLASPTSGQPVMNSEVRQQLLNQPISQQSVLPTQSQSDLMFQETSTTGCPVEFKHKISCGDTNLCKISMMPKSQLDWVDLHILSNSNSFLEAIGERRQSSTSSMIGQHVRMKLAAGSLPSSLGAVNTPQQVQQLSIDQSQLNSEADITLYGVDSSPSLLLKSSVDPVQVYQFSMPLKFNSNDLLSVAFTYHPSGENVECNSQVVKYILQDESTLTSAKQQKQVSPTIPPSSSPSVPQIPLGGASTPATSSTASSSSSSLPPHDLSAYDLTITTRTSQSMIPLERLSPQQ